MIKIVRLENCDNVAIKYRFVDSEFGTMLVAATEIGVCYMGFGDDIVELTNRFTGARIQSGLDEYSVDVLHLKGTDFQLKVWTELLKVGIGERVTYRELADRVGCHGGARAVGSAVGRNPISIVVPCHRVVASSGGLGGYYWGLELKKKILNSEK